MAWQHYYLSVLKSKHLPSLQFTFLLIILRQFFRVCCRSPIIPARPSYSAELMSLSYSGSLPRSSGTSGSAPDLTSEYRHAGGSSPVTDLWTNPLHDGTANGTVSRDALWGWSKKLLCPENESLFPLG